MGWYIRKSFGFGPLRLNLSRSGIGTSFGVRGARIGVGPRGAYVHAGTGGIYYRQNLGFGRRAPGAGQPPVAPASEPPREVLDTLGDEPIPASIAELVEDLRAVDARVDHMPAVVLGSSILIVILAVSRAPLTVVAATLLAAIALSVYMRHKDVTKGTLLLQYDGKGPAAEPYRRLVAKFDSLAESQKLWFVTGSEQTSDLKRSAGAGVVLTRRIGRAFSGLPRRVRSNVSFRVLSGAEMTLYFTPDAVLVYVDSKIHGLRYSDIRVWSERVEFRESESVPSDAQVVGSTWQFLNKDGSPDRRFARNPKIPILLYATIHLEGSFGILANLQASAHRAVEEFVAALGGIGCSVRTPGGQSRPANPGYQRRNPPREARREKKEESEGRSSTPPNPPPTDPFTVLGIARTASPDEIVAAYRTQARMYHPDKVAGLGPEIRDVADRKMKDINSAYDALRKAGRVSQ